MTSGQKVYLHKIVTLNPEKFYTQDFALDFLLKLAGDSEKKRTFLTKLYKGTHIRKRHTVIDDYDKDPTEYTFYPKTPTLQPEPSTAVRNDLFIKEAKRLTLKATKHLLDDAPEFEREKVTHLITVSCTGFVAPGLDFYLVRDLGLSPTIHRTNIGFMGCQGAFPALKMARDICVADSDARVLVINVELCSVHIQQQEELDVQVSNAIFADGISAALISSHYNDVKGNKFILDKFATSFAADTENDMAWRIGDQGFLMKLSVYVPQIVKENIKPLMDNLFEHSDIKQEDIDIWAIHPGGRAILERCQEALDITREDLDSSYRVMEEYGNMSSTTIMFVLADILDHPAKKGNVFAAAFGPGITVEAGLMEKIID
ncbi:type III polyketide synthase [Candidatus Thorarchaeota archaeon]|nr:MAG: type III polyketide synthase [Candidatus Thorarchaeota archaeon]